MDKNVLPLIELRPTIHPIAEWTRRMLLTTREEQRAADLVILEREVAKTAAAKDAEWQERVKPLVNALEEMQDKAGVFISAMQPGTLSQWVILRQLVEGFGNAEAQAAQALRQFEGIEPATGIPEESLPKPADIRGIWKEEP